MPADSPDRHADDAGGGQPDKGAPAQPEQAAPPDLASLRDRIDDVDKRLVELLNERARIVVDVGKTKQSTGTPIYAPHREAEVIGRAIESSAGPLPQRAIEGVYRELMSGSFALEQPLRIGYLGPPGSFSHLAAAAHFGSSVSFEDLHEISGVFTEVRRGHVDYGFAPIENSTFGSIAETLDAFRHAKGEVNIYAEALVAIRHQLLANCEPRDVKRIHSKPEVFSQCRRWLATQYPAAELVPAASSSQAVRTAKAEHDADPQAGAAAIGSALAGQLYGVSTLFTDVEDDPGNVTRFAIIARQEAQPSGDDKTAVMFTTDHRPGALVAVLGAFERHGLNLSHIDKRPTGRENFNYTFFVDVLGHRTDAAMAAAIEDARRRCRELSVLGSFPRAARIL